MEKAFSAEGLPMPRRFGAPRRTPKA
jgi:hypothetical protein